MQILRGVHRLHLITLLFYIQVVERYLDGEGFGVEEIILMTLLIHFLAFLLLFLLKKVLIRLILAQLNFLFIHINLLFVKLVPLDQGHFFWLFFNLNLLLEANGLQKLQEDFDGIFFVLTSDLTTSLALYSVASDLVYCGLISLVSLWMVYWRLRSTF